MRRGTVVLVIRAFAVGIFVTCGALQGALGAEERVNVDQGWSDKQRGTWYTTSQGSRLIPLSWIRALEQPGAPLDGTARLFLDPDHIKKFAYLPSDSGKPESLPIGFAIDKQDDRQFSEITKLRWKSPQSKNEPWLGLTCSACHTAELTYQGKRLRIDGGPTLADFQNFMKALNRALVETRDDQNKWDRFASAVLKGVDKASNRALLKSELAKLIVWQLKVEQANETPLEYGYGRLDAFGHIFNKVLLRVEAEDAQPKNPSDAPVSYPFLWNIHQQDKVQWNGIAPNLSISESLDVGALGRNVGEVVGVFGDVKLLPIGPAINGYRSSVNVNNLVLLEQLVSKLRPPAWPDVFPAIDPVKWEAGKNIFNNMNGGCVTCHDVLPRNDIATKVEVKMTPLRGPKAIGTDPWMACNAYTYEALSGVLRNTPKKFVAFSSLPLKENAALADMLGTTVIGILWNKKDEVLDSLGTRINPNIDVFDQHKGPLAFNPNELLAQLLERLHDDTKAERLKHCMTETSPILAYKGRPLTGIWATPPYLHNGSVPTLYDLLLPPDQRPASFSLGTREFDPVKVGYVTEPTADNRPLWPDEIFVFHARDDSGNPIAGNANMGHDYGNAALQPEDRMALIEYMKAIGGHREGSKIVP
jgi:hypothetical protein